MIMFSSLADVQKARLPPHLLPTVTNHMKTILSACGAGYDSSEDGGLVLVTTSDTDVSLAERLGCKWRESGFEGVSHDRTARCYSTMILHNNQFGITILIPDEPWLEQAIRNRMIREMEPQE